MNSNNPNLGDLISLDHKKISLLQQLIDNLLGKLIHREGDVRNDFKHLRFLIFFFKSQIILHMKLEENLNIFDEALKVSPELDSLVHSIFKDHEKLSDEITVISEITKEMNNYDIDALKIIEKKIKNFQHHQNQHEAWESEIMTAPYYSDYGG